MALLQTGLENTTLTLDLAKKYRDMRPILGERCLTSKRIKEHLKKLSRGRFFTLVWGDVVLNGTTYRANGQHTSYLLTACLQQHNGGLDERSKEFVEDFLNTKAAGGSVAAEDLPRIEANQLPVVIEHFQCDSACDLVDCFERYDCPDSTRTTRDISGIYVREWEGFRDIPVREVSWALGGVIRSLRKDPTAFGLAEDFQIPKGTRVAQLLRNPGIRDAVQWICESVSDTMLYKTPVGAQVCCDTYLLYGREQAERIIQKLIEQIELDEVPGSDYFNVLTKIRNRPSQTTVLKKGRNVIMAINKMMAG